MFIKKDLIKEVKAYIARELYARDDFYKILYKDDETVLKALKVVGNQKDYNKLLVSNHK